MPARQVRAEAGFRFRGSVTVFFPAYNDAPALPGLLKTTFDVLRRMVSDYEVIVVNDGSYDETAKVLESLERQYAPNLRVVTHARNSGYGAALRSGLLAATKEYVFYTDGDGQYDPSELELLLRAAGPNTGLVNGYKITRNDPWHRIAIGWLYNRFARWLFRIRLRDIDCDFRLIRRSVFDPTELQSTGGTICLELVRQLELSGSEVIEIPVKHLPRQHGRSQFFRVRALLQTSFQLCELFHRLVLLPHFDGSAETSSRPSRRRMAFVALAVTVLSLLAYARAIWLPFISDDYVQIQLARDYGPISRWSKLALDPLYRCRATSLVLTHWIERSLGLTPMFYNLTSLCLHIVNCLLVFALGLWRQVGWRVSGLAACFFAVNQRHSEAVVWFAAIPELLVFFFILTSVLLWVAWLDAKSWRGLLYAASFASYLLALLSKESAVIVGPLCALVLLFHPGRTLTRLWTLAPYSVVAAAYFALIYVERNSHLHFNDGTFSLHAPVFEVILRSAVRLLGVWGSFALVLFVARFFDGWRATVLPGLIWLVLGLLPYSFIAYMPRVPSRHTYLASVGISLVVASGFLAFRRRCAHTRQVWMVPTVACVILLHQCGYIWTVLHYRYSQRARPTELLLQAGQKHPQAIYAKCFPYSPLVAEYALMIELPPGSRPKFELGTEAAKQPLAYDFCNAMVEGKHY